MLPSSHQVFYHHLFSVHTWFSCTIFYKPLISL